MNRFILVIIIFISACNSSPDSSLPEAATKDSGNVVESKSDITSIDGCYMSVLKKDTATIKINNVDGQVNGNLVYKRFEKDNNAGTIKGIIKDSLLIADYTFQSEGTTSVRQVVFKLSGNTLLEGYGDINMNGDTAVFKDPAHLKFMDEQPFVKTECK